MSLWDLISILRPIKGQKVFWTSEQTEVWTRGAGGFSQYTLQGNRLTFFGLKIPLVLFGSRDMSHIFLGPKTTHFFFWGGGIHISKRNFCCDQGIRRETESIDNDTTQTGGVAAGAVMTLLGQSW